MSVYVHKELIHTHKVVVVGVKGSSYMYIPHKCIQETRDNVSKQYVCKKWFAALKR